MIQPPAQGEDTALLWRKVEELTRAVNALLNMTTTGAHEGKVHYTDQNAVLHLE